MSYNHKKGKKCENGLNEKLCFWRYTDFGKVRCNSMREEQWIFCPVCQSKTRLKMIPETEASFLPLFCPKCKQETLIHVHERKVYAAADRAHH